MRTIETTVGVSPERTLTATLPTDIQPSVYPIVLVIDEPSPVSESRRPFNLPTDDVGPWPEDLSLRREDMYDDDRR